MNLSDAGIALIKSFEGCKLDAYLDQVGVPTIGYGHTGSDISVPMSISQEDADNYFLDDIAKFEQGVNHLAPNVTQFQFDALVSFAYNLGLGSLQKSTLLVRLLAGDIAAAADQFLVWDRAGGVVSLGLARRRAAERKMFLGE